MADISIVNAPIWLWACGLGGFIVAEIIYYFWHRLLPYQGNMQWLIFADLVALVILDLARFIPILMSLGLRYLQTFFMLLPYVDSSNNGHSLFWRLYCPIIALSYLPLGLTTDIHMIHLGLAGVFHAAIATLFYRLDCYYRDRERDLEQDASGKKSLRWWWQIAFRDKQNNIVCNCQQSIFNLVYHCYQEVCRLHSLRGESASHVDVWIESENYVGMLVTANAILAQKKAPSEVSLQLRETVMLVPFLEKHFRTAHFINELSHLREQQQVICQPGFPLQIHFLEGFALMPEQTAGTDGISVEIAMPCKPMYCLIICTWLSYLLAWGPAKNAPKILISKYQSHDYVLKGVGTLDVAETCHRLEGIRCVFCGKQVRNLYTTSAISETACRECLKNKIEAKLKQDWEPSPTHNDITPFALASRLISYFELGYIQYGIQHWEQWEYFVTITIKVG